jgi:LysM domain
MLQQIPYNVYEGQSLYDVAAAVFGDTTLADELAIENNISVTELLQAGQKIKLVEAKRNQFVLKVFENAGIIPATAKTALVAGEEELDGINYMAIGTTFIVR